MEADDVYVLLNGKIAKLTEEMKKAQDWKPIHFAGSVKTAGDLPGSPKEGDMYNIESDSAYGASGMNVVWTAKGWDTMGSIIDLTPYLTKEEAEQLYQPKGDYISRATADKTYQKAGNYLTEDEASKKYQPVGEYLIGTDASLMESGKAADAAAVGKEVAELLTTINKTGTLENSIERYYAMRRTREIYTVEELDPDVTQSCAVNRLDGLAGLTCTPSTNTTAGKDEIGTLEAFRPINCNWILDDDGNQKITAIEGMPGYKTTGKINRGVLNMGLYYKKERNAEDNGWLHHWSMLPREKEGYRPMQECVRPDGTVQGWMIHPKGAAVEIDGAPYVSNGKPVRSKPSYANYSYARKRGPAYCFETDVDAAWVLALTMIKYGTKDLQAYMRGCTAYTAQYNVAVAEANTKRVILTKDQANYFVIGSSISIGNPGSNTNYDRGYSYMHNIVDSAVITGIEVVDNTHSALILDVEAPFTTATSYKVSTMHWETGSTDSVQGYDGSPVSNTDGKNICKINEIEILPGGYSVSGNSVHIMETDSDGNTICAYYRCDNAKLLSTNTDTIISTYTKVGTFPATNNTWKYIKEQLVDFGKGTMCPVDWGGGDKAFWADAWHTGSNPSAGQKSVWELLRRGNLNNGGMNGPSCVRGDSGLPGAWWDFLATLSPNAVRGEWQAAA